jgi:hypothetical protein
MVNTIDVFWERNRILGVVPNRPRKVAGVMSPVAETYCGGARDARRRRPQRGEAVALMTISSAGTEAGRTNVFTMNLLPSLVTS